MKAWYFAAKDNKLRHGDGRKIVIGETHSVECEPILCEQGLHASERLIDALIYAPGPMLYEVELSENIVKGEYKCCATHRTYIRGFDASDLLRAFVRRQALINIHKIKKYCRSDDDYNLIKQYLETGDDNLQSAAYHAAWSAARSAARVAAWSAARSADDAARSAAWSAAYHAAKSAAWSAAWSAAYHAARSAANGMLTEMVEQHFAKMEG